MRRTSANWRDQHRLGRGGRAALQTGSIWRDDGHETEGDLTAHGAQGIGSGGRPRGRDGRDHRLPDGLGEERHHASPVRHRRVEHQRHCREVQGRPRHHAGDDGARFGCDRPAGGDPARFLRHRRHRVLDLQEGLPGRRHAADGRQEDQVFRQDRAALHYRQADARFGHRAGHRAAYRRLRRRSRTRPRSPRRRPSG